MTQLFTIDEAAEYLRVPRSWVSDHVQRGDVPHTRLPGGRLVRFTQQHLDAIVAAGEHQPEVVALVSTGGRGRRRS